MADPGNIVAKDAYGFYVETTPEEAQARGLQIASPEEAAAHAREEQYGGILGTGTAAVTGALRGATLGLSDVAISELGGRETLQALREVNPGASIGGEVVGSLAGLGKAGGLISAPARLATRAGEAVARGAASPLVGAVARAATEGAIFGAGQAVSESTLKNQELTAEMLASHAFRGATWGAGTAGALGLAGRGAGTLLDRVRQKVTGKGLERLAGEHFGHRAVGAWDKAASMIGGAPEGAVASMFQRGKSGRLGFEAALGADDIIERSADDFTEQLRGVLARKRAIEARLKGDLKEDQIAQLVRRGNEAEVRAASQMALDSLGGKLDEMARAGNHVFGSQKMLSALRGHIRHVAGKIEKHGDDVVAHKAFMELDQLKRRIGGLTRGARRKMSRHGGMSEHRATFEAMKDIYEDLRTTLESEQLWGKAGMAQRRINADWTGNIRTNDMFERLFTNRREGDWGAVWHEASRDKVAEFVRSMTNPNKSDAMRALSEQMDTLESFARTADEVMHLPPSERRAIAELSEYVAGMRSKLDEAAEAITQRNQLRALDQAGGVSEALGTVGAIIGGAPGALAGKAVEVITRPGQMIRQIAAMHSLLARTEAKNARALARITRSAVPKVREVASRTAPRIATQAAHARERYETLRTSAQRPPETVRTEAYASMGDLVLGAPETAARAADQAVAASQYLGAQLPPEALPSPPEMRRFLEIADALSDPTEVLEGAANGRIRIHQVQAIRDVYPEVYQQMRMSLADEIAALEADGKQLPYGQRIALGVAFELDTDPMLSLMPSLQAGYESAADDPGPPPAPSRRSGPAPDVASSMRTGVEDRLDEE